MCCKGLNNEMLCASGPDVWGEVKGPTAESLALRLSSIIGQWGLQRGRVLQDSPLIGNIRKLLLQGKVRKKESIKESTAIFTLGPVLWSCSPSGKPNTVQALFHRKHLSNQDFFYWSHLFNRIAHHLKVN